MFAYAKQENPVLSKNIVQKKEVENTVSELNMSGIPNNKKAHLENVSGYTFGDVRVHYNSNKPKQLQALACTHGNRVYIAKGQERHLEHELRHVVQQKQGRTELSSLPVVQRVLKIIESNENNEKKNFILLNRLNSMYI